MIAGAAAGGRGIVAEVARQARIVGTASAYEFRKATAFRAGFVAREIVAGLDRPIVMLFLYSAMFAAGGADRLGGFRFGEILHYLMWVAVLQKLLVRERFLELSEHIFEGYLTKFLVMPFRYFALVAGKFLQYTLTQMAVAAAFYVLGLLLLPGLWPRPAGLAVLLQALVLVLLGSWCYLLVLFILNSLAFWLDVVWTLVVMSRFVMIFLTGAMIPIPMMPGWLQAACRALFPYWALAAPVEMVMGRVPPGTFGTGLLVLLATAAGLHLLAAVVWRRGLRRYTGAGM